MGGKSFKYDAILDSGANNNILPSIYEPDVQNLVTKPGTLFLGDDSMIPTYARASYGILDNVILCHKIACALISVSYLTKQLKLYVFYSYDRAFIIQRIQNKSDTDSNTDEYIYKTVATATLHTDMLFHIDDMRAFLEPLAVDNVVEPTALFSISDHPYTMREMKYGGARIFIKSGRQYLTLLQWLHVRLGHANESLLRWIIDKNVVLGAGMTKADISKLELGPCDTCQRSRMHAFAMPPSISRKVYEVFEYLSADYMPFNKITHGTVRSLSKRGFTGAIVYTDKATGKVFGYLVKKKSEWFDTFQKCILDHGIGANPRSSKLRFLLTDFASELHTAETTKFIEHNQIRLLNSAPHKKQQNLIERYIQSLLNMMRTAMTHNHTPIRYWCYAFMYMIDTYNMLCQYGNTVTRNEAFSGEKTDISACVPFYSQGWAFRSPEERLLHTTRGQIKPLKDHAVQVLMLGYCQPYPLPDSSNSTPYIKNSYICLVPSTNTIMPRHDCLFNNSPASALTNYEVNTSNNADGVTSTEEEFDYDFLFGPRVDPSLWEASDINEEAVDEDTDPRNDDEPEEVESSIDRPIIDPPPEITDEVTLNDRNTPYNDGNTSSQQASEKQFIIHILPNKRASIRTSKPTEKYGEYVEKMRKARQSCEDPNDPHKKVFIDPVVANVMKQVFPEMATEGIDPSPRIPMPKETPKNLKEALASSESVYWYIAWQTEMLRLTQRCSWVETAVPEGKTKVKSKFAFRVTHRVDGSLKFRCRLVACGYSQILGLDYDETYAPTAKYKSLCIVLHLAAVFGWYIDGIDVENAFLESEIDKEIYMTLPIEAYIDSETGKPASVRLLRSIYGLKQAGELWYQLLNKLILQQGFTRLMHDQCVYIKRDDLTNTVTIIIIYVDDVLFIGNNRGQINESISELSKAFTKLTGTTDITRYIGIDIERDLEKHTIKLSQKPYTEKYVSEHIDDDVQPKSIPMSPSLDYGPKGDGTNPPIQDKVGQLRYLADRTRPDILTAVGLLGSSAANPSSSHTKGVHQLGRYLKGTTDYAITLGGDDERVLLFGYTDASHLPDDSSKPRLAYCFFLNRTSGVIYARSFKDTSVSHSSCESEIKAIDGAIRQAVWMRGILAELGFPQNGPTVLYTDSVSAKALADTARLGSNSSHLVLRINYIHECIENGTIELKYITTENEVADVLTKLLPLPTHEQHTRILLHGHGGKEPDVRTRLEATADDPTLNLIEKSNKRKSRFRIVVTKRRL